MTVYTQYQLPNPPSQALDILAKLGQNYSFRSEFNQAYRILTVITKDVNLISFIDSKTIPNITKSAITILEYDDTKSIEDVIALVQSSSDVSTIRPELLVRAQAIVASNS